MKPKTKSLNIELQGGLGNQLFIWVAGRYLAQEKGQQVVYRFKELRSPTVFDLLGLVDEPGNSRRISQSLLRLKSLALRLEIIRTVIRKLFGIYVSREIGFEKDIISSKKIKWAFGYFQTHKFVSDEILKEMRIKMGSQFISPAELEIKELIKQDEFIVIHIRVGDYLKPENQYFGILSEQYYLDGLIALKVKVNQKVLIVTDSPNYIRRNYGQLLKTYENCIFAADYHLTTIEEFRILTAAKKIIIGNSTFSWWGAFLGPEVSEVVAPNKWFKHENSPNSLLPTSWNLVNSRWI